MSNGTQLPLFTVTTGNAVVSRADAPPVVEVNGASLKTINKFLEQSRYKGKGAMDIFLAMLPESVRHDIQCGSPLSQNTYLVDKEGFKNLGPALDTHANTEGFCGSDLDFARRVYKDMAKELGV